MSIPKAAQEKMEELAKKYDDDYLNGLIERLRITGPYGDSWAAGYLEGVKQERIRALSLIKSVQQTYEIVERNLKQSGDE